MAFQHPSRLQVDGKDGNHYLIFDVVHTSGTETKILVPDSAVSVTELPANQVATAGLAKETNATTDGAASAHGNDADGATQAAAGDTIVLCNSTSDTDTGIGWDTVAGDGQKVVSISSNAASLTYKVIVRLVGSPAGQGAGNSADL